MSFGTLSPMFTAQLVSVVIAVRNGEAHLDKTLHSVRQQSHTDLEVIVVDDGSTDGTAEIVRRHSCDERVRLVQTAACGVARARNLAIGQARGEFVAVIDADDLWHPAKVASHVERFAAGDEQLAAVWSPLVTIDEDDRIISEVLAFDRATMAVTEGWVLLPLIYRFFPPCGSTVTFRTSVLREVGGYSSDMVVGADLDLMLRIAERSKIGVVPRPPMGYRRVPGSMSSRPQTNLRSQKQIFRDARSRVGWIPRWVMRWSLAGRYVSASSRAFWSSQRGRGVLYGVLAVCCDPFVLLHPTALPRTLGLAFSRTRSSPGDTGRFPDDVERFLDEQAGSSGWLYRTYAFVEERRRRRMLAAELTGRGVAPPARSIQRTSELAAEH
jgi:glycosyltransferase involved in cell wall biosynthesis